MRMEKFEYEFVKETGVRVIIGKGGMKENTERACKEFGPLIVSIDANGDNLFEERLNTIRRKMLLQKKSVSM